MIDSKWFRKLEKIHSQKIRPIDSNLHENDKEKVLFLSNEIENPHFSYKHIEKDNIKMKQKNLFSLRKELIKDEKDPTIRKLYTDYIGDYIKKTNLFLAAADSDMEAFLTNSIDLFGDIDSEIWGDAVKRIARDGNKNIPHSVFVTARHSQFIKLPGKQLFNEIKGSIISHSDISAFEKEEGQEITAKTTKRLLEKTMLAFNIDGNVRIKNTNRNFIYITHGSSIILPKNYRRHSWQKLIELCAHEVLGHLRILQASKKQKLGLLRFGLPGHILSEEGIASLCSQVFLDKLVDFSGLKQYFAVGLARGIDGKARNFRELYEILLSYYLFHAPLSIKDTYKWAQSKAFHLCVRTFRGTDCRTKGICYTKDIIYRTGNIKIWRLLEKRPDQLPYFFIGKYDPTNIQQCIALNELGIATQ